MKELKEHRCVRGDIEQALHWYEDQRAGLGRDWVVEIRAVFSRLPHAAFRYSVRFDGIRRVNLKRFPYAVFYEIEGDEIRVLGVLHVRRRHERLLAGRRRTFES
jgi:toxin ParE1/3/4